MGPTIAKTDVYKHIVMFNLGQTPVPPLPLRADRTAPVFARG